MNSIEEVWINVLEYIKTEYVLENKKISEVAFKTWIKSLSLHDINGDAGDNVIITAQSEFQAKTSSKYLTYITEGFEAVLGFSVNVNIIAAVAEKQPTYNLNSDDDYSLRKFYANDEEAPAVSPSNYHITSNETQLSDEYTFDNFVVGSSNKFAHAACLAVSQNPSGIYNPLFIYGPSGLGKTHLLNAIRREILLNNPGTNILMIKGVDFMSKLIDSIQNGKVKDFHESFVNVNVLLVDDIQFIAGAERTQEEFFHTFDRLFEAKKQIVISSDRPPREIHPLTDRLRNRFESGLLADIQYPDLETRVAIIRRKAEALKLQMSDEVCDFIATRLKSNIRQLEGTVKKLKVYSELSHEAPTISLAQITIGDILSEEQPVPVTVERILNEVCRIYTVTLDDLKSKKRTNSISLARKTAVYIIHTVTGMSLNTLGNEFNRDHSTVSYFITDVEKEMQKNSFYKNQINDIIKNIKN